MRSERHPGSLSGLSDDQLGTIAVSLAISELRWAPDVAPAVMDRISRDAVAYPDQFDRRPQPPVAAVPAVTQQPSVARTLTRLAVLLVIVVMVSAIVLVAATANGAAAFLGGLDPAGLAPVSVTEAYDPETFRPSPPPTCWRSCSPWQCSAWPHLLP